MTTRNQATNSSGSGSRLVRRVATSAFGAPIRHLQQRIDAQRLRILLNDGDGALVVARYGGLSGDSPVVLVPTDVGRLWMARWDTIMRPLLLHQGFWEPEECAFLRRSIAPGSNVVNVGANVGYTSLVLADTVGAEGQVIALEPEPLNYRLLCMNTTRSGNVLPIHSAGGDHTGTIRLNRSATNPGDHRTAAHEDDIGGIDVPIVTLDDLLGDRRVEAIVVDAQGFDHRVIAGARATIERCRPLITVEFWPFGISNIGDDPAAVLQTFRSFGYSRLIDVPSGADLSGRTDEEIIAGTAATYDQTTLALIP